MLSYGAREHPDHDRVPICRTQGTEIGSKSNWTAGQMRDRALGPIVCQCVAQLASRSRPRGACVTPPGQALVTCRYWYRSGPSRERRNDPWELGIERITRANLTYVNIDVWSIPGTRAHQLVAEQRVHRLTIGEGHPKIDWRLQCKRCPGEFIAGQHQRLYCDDCRDSHRRESAQRRQAASRARRAR